MLSLLLPLFLIAASVSAQCPSGVRQRREIRTLSASEWTVHANAINQLYSAGTYDDFVQIHVSVQRTAHGTAQFFPWHRAYLVEFERALQAIDASIMLPYWNWAYDSQAPETSIVFTADYYGGNGQRRSGCVQDGQFAHFRVQVPSRGCLSRAFDGGDRLTSYYSTEALNSVLVTTSYDQMRRGIETAPHGSVHNSIGGTMVSMGSPGDPIFWLHHAFVDKIWADWQSLGQGRERGYGGSNPDGSSAALSDRLSQYPQYTVGDVMDTRSLCYTYAELTLGGSVTSIVLPQPVTIGTGAQTSAGNGTVTGSQVPPRTSTNTTTTTVPVVGGEEQPRPRQLPIRPRPGRTAQPELVRRADNDKPSVTPLAAPDAGDRSDLVLLRKPRPLPQDWIAMNNFHESEFRHHESQLSEVVDRVNSIDDYVSPCALWLRDDILARIATKVDKFIANVRGQRVEYTVDKNKASTDQRAAVIDMKKSVRDQCGGSVRGEATKYHDLLERFIGKVVSAADSITYPYTEPLKHPGKKVTDWLHRS